MVPVVSMLAVGQDFGGSNPCSEIFIFVAWFRL